jgi:hypothetical protein
MWELWRKYDQSDWEGRMGRGWYEPMAVFPRSAILRVNSRKNAVGEM